MEHTEKVVYRKGRYTVVKSNEDILGNGSWTWFYDVYHGVNMVSTFLSLKEARYWVNMMP